MSRASASGNGVKVDQRAVFFWFSAVLSVVLLPVTPDKFRWVGIALAIVLVLLGTASYIDNRVRHSDAHRQRIQQMEQHLRDR